MAKDAVQTENVSKLGASTVPQNRFLRIRSLNTFAIILAAIISIFVVISLERVVATENRSEKVNDDYRTCISAVRDLQEASDYLTSQVRVYVVTGHREYLDAYIEEIEVADRRGKAVQTLRDYMGEEPAVKNLEKALSYSDELAERELYAMRLTAMTSGLDDLPEDVAKVVVSPEDEALSAEQKRMRAEEMVLGDEYQMKKLKIYDEVGECSEKLFAQLEEDVLESNRKLHQYLNWMQVFVFLLLIIIVFVTFAIIFLVLWPMATYAYQIKRDEKLIVSGADELRYLAEAYNTIYEENRERTRRLRYAAERDPLTGLYNRRAYDELIQDKTTDVALLIIDVDYFKSVNDTYGHKVGDEVLEKVAHSIDESFRDTDFVCRIGGDEFAVIMTGVSPDLKSVVAQKVEDVAHKLKDVEDGLPEITLSVGIAFSADLQIGNDLFHAADEALYVVKESGRNNYAFYGET